MQSKSRKIRKMKGGSERGISGEIYILVNIDETINSIIYLHKIVVNLEKLNFTANVRAVWRNNDKFIKLKEYTKLENPLNEYINKLKKEKNFDYCKYLEEGISSQLLFEAASLTPEEPPWIVTMHPDERQYLWPCYHNYKTEEVVESKVIYEEILEALKIRAAEVGVDEQAIADAANAEDAKGKMISLILEAQGKAQETGGRLLAALGEKGIEAVDTLAEDMKEKSSEKEFTGLVKDHLTTNSLFIVGPYKRNFKREAAGYGSTYFLSSKGWKERKTEHVKLHISVKYKYLWDALELLNEYGDEKLNDHFPIFKFFWGGFRHVEWKNQIGILKSFSKPEFREYIKEREPLLSTGAANIVLYPKKVKDKDDNESLINLKKEVLEPFITWWNEKEEQRDWKRDRNYLYFNIRLGETLFMAYGHDTDSRFNCFYETYPQLRDSKCKNFIREKPIDVMQNLRNKFCSIPDDINATDKECLLDRFNLTKEQLCDVNKNSLPSIYGIRDDIGEPPMETDLHYGDTFCGRQDEMDIVLKKLTFAKIAKKQLDPTILQKIGDYL
jgi:hypothetical protein